MLVLQARSLNLLFNIFLKKLFSEMGRCQVMWKDYTEESAEFMP